MNRALLILTTIALLLQIAPVRFGVSAGLAEPTDAKASLSAVEDERGIVALDQT